MLSWTDSVADDKASSGIDAWFCQNVIENYQFYIVLELEKNLYLREFIPLVWLSRIDGLKSTSLCDK